MARHRVIVIGSILLWLSLMSDSHAIVPSITVMKDPDGRSKRFSPTYKRRKWYVYILPQKLEKAKCYEKVSHNFSLNCVVCVLASPHQIIRHS